MTYKYVWWLFDSEEQFNKYKEKNKFPLPTIGKRLAGGIKTTKEVNVKDTDAIIKDPSSIGKIVALGVADLSDSRKWKWAGVKVQGQPEDPEERMRELRHLRDQLAHQIVERENDIQGVDQVIDVMQDVEQRNPNANFLWGHYP
jgi:hypothetical protein